MQDQKSIHNSFDMPIAHLWHATHGQHGQHVACATHSDKTDDADDVAAVAAGSWWTLQEQNDDKRPTGNSCNCSGCTLKRTTTTATTATTEEEATKTRTAELESRRVERGANCKKVKSARIDLGSRRRRGRATNWFCGGRLEAAGCSDRGCSATSAAAFHSLSASIEAAGSPPSLYISLSHSLPISVSRYMSSALLWLLPAAHLRQMEMKMKLATQTPELGPSLTSTWTWWADQMDI